MRDKIENTDSEEAETIQWETHTWENLKQMTFKTIICTEGNKRWYCTHERTECYFKNQETEL